jgi:hypothetical protein
LAGVAEDCSLFTGAAHRGSHPKVWRLLTGPAALAAPVVAGSGEVVAGAGPHGLYWLTVEIHLSGCYRKLAVPSRAELAAALDADG